MSVDSCFDGEEAAEYIRGAEYDAVVMAPRILRITDGKIVYDGPNGVEGAVVVPEEAAEVS